MDNKVEIESVVFASKPLRAMQKRLPEIDYLKGMAMCNQDEEFYLELITDYIQMPVVEELKALYKEGNNKDYCIKVHAFKNNSYTIGADEIGELAYALEQGSRNGFADGVEQMQGEMFDKYGKISEQCKRIIEIYE